MSAFSSPPAPPKVPHPFTYIGTDKLQWIPEALLLGKPLGSPLFSVAKLVKHATELTPKTEFMVNESLKALLLPSPALSFMDRAVAKDSLKKAAEKMTTRAAKRSYDKAAAAEAQEAKNQALGQAKRAKREEIGKRVPMSERVVYNKAGKRVS